MSLALRHQPDVIGIGLDDEGWVPVLELIKGINKKGIKLDYNGLKIIVAENNKKRFSFNDDGSKIRANQGHSIEVDLKLQSIEPPVVLYHGTVGKFMASINENGLIKGNRQHVHLSKDKETATNVGSRRGIPTILTVNAKMMYDAGYEFYLSKNGVWLTDFVPVEFINFK